jgi:hypothetical protein
MFHRFPMHYARVSPWVFFLWLLTVVIAAGVVILAFDGGVVR